MLVYHGGISPVEEALMPAHNFQIGQTVFLAPSIAGNIDADYALRGAAEAERPIVKRGESSDSDRCNRFGNSYAADSVIAKKFIERGCAVAFRS
jgi:hypothetical protein